MAIDNLKNYKFDLEFNPEGGLSEEWVLAPSGKAAARFVERKLGSLQARVKAMSFLFQNGASDAEITTEEFYGLGDIFESFGSDLDKMQEAMAEDLFTLKQCFLRDTKTYNAHLKLRKLMALPERELEEALGSLPIKVPKLSVVAPNIPEPAA